MPERPAIRVAVLGAARFAETAHIPGVNAHPAASVRALYGRDLPRVKEMAARAGATEATDDLDALLARDDIDAVTVASSDDQHAPYTLAAARAGKHVLCEKPLTLHTERAAEMLHAARAAGIVHQVAFTFRHTWCLQEMRRMVASGEIGEPYFADISGEWLRPLTGVNAQTWRDDPALHGHGYIGEMGTHYIDAANFVLGDVGGHISELTASTRAVERPHATPDLAAILFRTSGGVDGRITVSRVTPAPAAYAVMHGNAAEGHMGSITVTGTKGALNASFSRGTAESLRAQRPGGEWTRVQLPAGADDGTPHALPRMFACYVDAIIGGADASGVAATFDDGYRAQAALDAIFTAAAERRWVEVPPGLPE